MRNRYAAVARTFPQRLFSGGLAAMWMIILPVMIVIPFLDRYDLSQTSLPLKLLMPGAAFVIGVLAIHLKQLVIDAKSRLLPRPTRAAMVVTGGCAAAYLIGLPLLMNLRGGVPLLGSAALLWMWFAAVFHIVIRPSLPTLTVMGLVYGLSRMNPSPLKTWLAAADDPLVAGLLLLASIVWFAIVTRWLVQMGEESPGYQPVGLRQPDWKNSPASTAEATQVWRNPARARWLSFGVPAEQRLQHATQPGASDHLWNRCRRWRSVNQRQYTIWVMLLVMGTMDILSPQNDAPLPEGLPSAAFGPALMLYGMVLSSATISYVQQWKYRGIDLLKPVRREVFLREMGLCLAMDLFRNLFIVALLLAALTALLAPARLLQIHSRDMILISLLGICGTVFAFGCIVWFLRYRLMVVVGLIIPAILIPVIIAMPVTRAFLPTALLVAAALVLSGLWLTRDAYRRWLLTDLG